MNLEKIKTISIQSYMQNIGYQAQKESDYYGMYLSPYREDTQASMKVDYNQNLWYDHGAGEGGSIIDLVMKIEQCTFVQAIEKLKNTTSFSFHRKKELAPRQAIQVRKIKELENKALLQYLESRYVNVYLAKRYCQEAYYSVASKNYFAICFANIKGGYELRSKYFKGSSNKGISFIDVQSDSLLVFEGFMDFLSHITINEKEIFKNILVLNSLSNIKRAESYLQNSKCVELYLDNDNAGNNYTNLIIDKYKNVIDRRNVYDKHKDYNEYLISQS